MRTLICCTVFTILPLCLWRYGKWRRPSRFRFSGKEASQHSRCVAQHSYTVFTKSCAPLRWVVLRFLFFFYVKTVWKTRWVREEDRGVRYAGKISHFTVRGTWTWCRCARFVMPVVFLWRPWSICHTCSTHCASAGPCTLSFPCDTRGRMLRVNTSHHRAAQFTDLTTDCPSVLAGTHGWSTVW